jgi:hypothetical protein
MGCVGMDPRVLDVDSSWFWGGGGSPSLRYRCIAIRYEAGWP